MYALCLWFKFMEYVYGPSLWVLFRHTFYEVVFYFDFRGCVIALSFQSHIWIDYTCCVYGYILWKRFTGRVCDLSVGAEFTYQVYELSLLVVFSGWLCRFSSWVDFTDELTGLVYGHDEGLCCFLLRLLNMVWVD